MFRLEFKKAAVRRLEVGASIAELARAYEVTPQTYCSADGGNITRKANANQMLQVKFQFRCKLINIIDIYSPGRNNTVNSVSVFRRFTEIYSG